MRLPPAVLDETRWRVVLSTCWMLLSLSSGSGEVLGCLYTQSLWLGQRERGGPVSQSPERNQISHMRESVRVESREISKGECFGIRWCSHTVL